MFINFREKGREKEKHQLVASCTHPDQGMELAAWVCPDQASNPQPFGVRNNTPTN